MPPAASSDHYEGSRFILGMPGKVRPTVGDTSKTDGRNAKVGLGLVPAAKGQTPHQGGAALRQIWNASTPLATITKAMKEGQGCARKALTINPTDTAKKSHRVTG